MGVILVAFAPVLALLVYFYVRDKYEKEPLKMLVWAFVLGMLSTILAIFMYVALGATEYSGSGSAASIFLYSTFVIGFVEELAKFIPLVLVLYRSKEFNEPYDGIIYGVFVSLGFAMVENVNYISSGGYEVGFWRAFTAVPGHAVYGAVMGYFVGMAKFTPERQKILLFKGLLYAILLHGIYDFFLFVGMGAISLLLAIGVVIFGWRYMSRKMSLATDASPFNPLNQDEDEVEE